MSSLDKGHRKMPRGEKNNFSNREEQREEHLNWTFSKGRASVGTVRETVVSGGAGGTVQNTGEAILMMRPNAPVHCHSPAYILLMEPPLGTYDKGQLPKIIS